MSFTIDLSTQRSTVLYKQYHPFQNLVWGRILETHWAYYSSGVLVGLWWGAGGPSGANTIQPIYDVRVWSMLAPTGTPPPPQELA